MDTPIPFGWPPRLAMRLATVYTGLSKWSLYRAMKNGDLRAIGRRGRTYVFERSELDAFMVGANCDQPHRPAPPARTMRASAPANNTAAIDRIRRIARKQARP
jgi:hypothetical protein